MNQSIFYKTDFDFIKKIEILNDSYLNSYDYDVDLLDMNISFHRIPTNLNYDEVMDFFDDICHFVIIKRFDLLKEAYYGEVGFSTIKGNRDYFLFLFLELNKMEEIIEKYKLEVY